MLKKKNLIIFSIIEIAALLVSLILMISNWKKEQILSPGVEFWASNYSDYNGGWYVDESVRESMGDNEIIDIVYGPYISIPAGEYSLTVTYESNRNHNVQIHSFENDDKIKMKSDVLIHNTNTMSYTGVLNTQTFHFVVLEDIDNVEARIDYDGNGYVFLNNIVIASSARNYRYFMAIVFAVFAILDLIIAAYYLEREKQIGISALFKKVLPWAVFICVFVFDILFIIIKGKYYIDSDMSAEMILGSLQIQEMTVAVKNFYYSTGIQVGGLPTLLAIGLSVFKNNWIAARAFGTAVALAIMSLSLFCLLNEMGISRSKAVIIATMLITPFSVPYMNLITFGAYYVVENMYIMICLVLSIVLIKEGISNKTQIVCFIAISLISLYRGISGIKSIMYFYGPFVAATVVILIMSINKNAELIKQFKCKEWKTAALSIYLAIMALVGYLINSFVLSKNFTYMDANTQTWGSISIARLLDVYSWFLDLFGSQNTYFSTVFGTNQTAPRVVSLQGVIHLFGIIAAFAVVFALFRICKLWNELSYNRKLCVSLLVSMLLINGCIFAWTDGATPNQSYWIFTIPFAFCVFSIWTETEKFSFENTRTIIPRLLCACFLITGFGTVIEYQAEPVRAYPGLVDVADFIEENGYTKGYARFWNSDVITELTDGQVEMWTLEHYSDRPLINPWLQKVDHNNQPTGKVFVLNERGESIQNTPYLDGYEGVVVYKDLNGYEIIEYNVE